MDTLKGKQIMVWTFMGNARMYEALRDYGDRISQIGLFSFKVRATGEIYERAAWRFRICSPTSTNGPISSGC